jgi:chromosome segregation ATPase
MAMNTGITNHNTGHIRKMLRCYDGEHDKRTITERAVYRAVRAVIERITNDHEYRQSLVEDEQPDADAWNVQIANVQAQIERAKAGRRRADDAYTDGLMDYDNYQRQIKRLKEQLEILELEIGRLNEEMTQAADTGKRRQRLDEIAADGLAKLDDPDVKAANAWLRRMFQVWVRDHRVVEVHCL